MSVFHLKYRPSILGDLDSKEVVKSLTNLLKAKELPQALLFSGPKGAGKTSAARIVARCLNCTDRKGVEPCGVCPSCKEILSGSSLDVIEIDAASNRGIEEARSLKDRAYLSPARLSKKVFVIDEVHMMTRDAFNALLKLLEEPPKQTVFILCTTDEDKIPDTVLSRLIKVQFEKGSIDEMVKSIQRVAEGEGIEVDKKTLTKIANNCDRSFRNLHKLFNELFIELGKDMTEDKVDKYFLSRFGEYTPELFEEDVSKEELVVVLKNFESMAKAGVDFRAFRERLISYFQTKLLNSCGVEIGSKSLLELNQLEKLIQLLITAGKLESESFIPQLPLELVVIDLIGKDGVPGEGKHSRPASVISKPKIPEVVEVPNAVPKTISRSKINIGVEKVSEDWGRVLMAVKPFNHSVEAFLRAVRPAKISGNVLICEVYYPFHKDKLEELKNRHIVEKGLMSVFGVEMVFECVLAKSKLEPIVVKNDTPDDVVTVTTPASSSDEMYDVAKQIFG